MANAKRSGMSHSPLFSTYVLIVATTQILRKDFLSQQKQWEHDLVRSAPELAEAPDDDVGQEATIENDQESKSA